MQILAPAMRFANKYYYQLDSLKSLKLSRDQKQYLTVTGETLSL